MRCLSIYLEAFSKDIQSRLKQGTYLVSLHICTYMHYAFISYILATTVNVQHATDAAKGELKMAILVNSDINICIIL